MKYLIVLLVMLSTSVLAGPKSDRAQTMIDALYGSEVKPAAVTRIVEASLTTYQAWVPYRDVVVGTEECEAGTCDIVESQLQDVSKWTDERKAGFFLRVVRKELRQRVRQVAEQKAHAQAKSAADAAVALAGKASQTDI